MLIARQFHKISMWVKLNDETTHGKEKDNASEKVQIDIIYFVVLLTPVSSPHLEPLHSLKENTLKCVKPFWLFQFCFCLCFFDGLLRCYFKLKYRSICCFSKPFPNVGCFLIFIFVQGRLQMDVKVSCTWLLLISSYARLYSRYLSDLLHNFLNVICSFLFALFKFIMQLVFSLKLE